MAANPGRKSASKSLHSERFPGESGEYRKARDRLLEAEIELRRSIEKVAALRRELPLGGPVPQDYEFEECAAGAPDSQTARRVRMSELFEPGKANTLVIYSFMYGPKMERPCPSCTSILDSLDGGVLHAAQRVNVAVVAKSPIYRIHALARQRGWRNLRLLSSATNSYNRDYHAEDAKEAQLPVLNVFVRRGGGIHHFYATELLFAPRDPGQEPRHVDSLWPLWNILDLTPEGRGKDWHPRLSYGQ